MINKFQHFTEYCPVHPFYFSHSFQALLCWFGDPFFFLLVRPSTFGSGCVFFCPTLLTDSLALIYLLCTPATHIDCHTCGIDHSMCRWVFGYCSSNLRSHLDCSSYISTHYVSYNILNWSNNYKILILISYLRRHTAITWTHGIPESWGFWHVHSTSWSFFTTTLYLQSWDVYTNMPLRMSNGIFSPCDVTINSPVLLTAIALIFLVFSMCLSIFKCVRVEKSCYSCWHCTAFSFLSTNHVTHL